MSHQLAAAAYQETTSAPINSAKVAYLNALISETPAARYSATTQLFQNLGHVLHHVQDMAQPQHVRNDAHCDAPVCAVLASLGVQGTGAEAAPLRL